MSEMKLDITVGPEIGMGATMHVGSDSYAYTINDLSNEKVKFRKAIPGSEKWNPETKRYEYEYAEVAWPKWIAAVRDKAVIIKGSGHDGSAEYSHSSEITKRGEKFYLKDGWYRAETKKWNPETKSYEGTGRTSIKNQRLAIGYRRTYRDPSF